MINLFMKVLKEIIKTKVFLIVFSFGLLIALNFCSRSPVSGNHNPEIKSIIASKNNVNLGETITVKAIYIDIDGDSLRANWSASGGIFSEIKGDSTRWMAPDTSGIAAIFLEVDDQRGGKDIDSVIINIENQPPVIYGITLTPFNVFLENTATLRVLASDPDGHSLSYFWSAKRDGRDVGRFENVSGDSAVWIAPSTSGTVMIKVIVTDIKGGETTLTKTIKVYSAIGSVWVCDTFNNRVVMLSNTGDILYIIDGFNNPKGIDINKNNRTVLVADWGNNQVVKISADGKIIKKISGFVYPHSVSIRSFDGSAWVCQDGDSSQVVKITPEGVIVRSIHGFKNPLSICVDQKTGDIWVADTGNNRIVKLLENIPDGYDITRPPSITEQAHKIFSTWNNINFNNPVGISVNSSNGNCWFADKGNNRIVRILKDGSEIYGVEGFFNPECVGINRKSLEAWVTDTGNNRVIKLLQLDKILQPPIYNVSKNLGLHWIVPGNYRQPIALSVNSNEGEVWYTEEYRVVRISPNGSIMDVVGFDSPKGIVVNPGIE